MKTVVGAHWEPSLKQAVSCFLPAIWTEPRCSSKWTYKFIEREHWSTIAASSLSLFVSYFTTNCAAASAFQQTNRGMHILPVQSLRFCTLKHKFKSFWYWHFIMWKRQTYSKLAVITQPQLCRFPATFSVLEQCSRVLLTLHSKF